LSGIARPPYRPCASPSRTVLSLLAEGIEGIVIIVKKLSFSVRAEGIQ